MPPLVLLLLVACRAPEAPAALVVRGPRAARVVIDPGEVRFEVLSRALVREGHAVWLVGMVHVGDPAFYGEVDALIGPGPALIEGLAPDPAAPAADDVAVDLDALGLGFQSELLPLREGWRRSDLGVVEVRAALLARGTDPGPWLDDRDRSSLRDLLGGVVDERTRSLARLAMVAGLAGEPPADEVYWDVIVGLRDAAVIADALDEPSGVAVVYGADHLPDLEARLLAEGFVRAEDRWLAAIRVPYAGLGLGPVQVRQLLELQGP